MQTIRLAALAAALLCTATGCSKTTAPPPGESPAVQEAAPQPTEPPKRADLLGNPILTSYAEGEFSEEADGKLIMHTDAGTREFLLTERSKNDIVSLDIRPGTRIIVNYNVLEDGSEEAESLEVLIEE